MTKLSLDGAVRIPHYANSTQPPQPIFLRPPSMYGDVSTTLVLSLH